MFCRVKADIVISVETDVEADNEIGEQEIHQLAISQIKKGGWFALDRETSNVQLKEVAVLA